MFLYNLTKVGIILEFPNLYFDYCLFLVFYRTLMLNLCEFIVADIWLRSMALHQVLLFACAALL